MNIVCYADDTLMTARDSSYQEVVCLAESDLHLVIVPTEALGVFIPKTYPPPPSFFILHKRPRPLKASLRIQGQEV